MDNGYRGYWLLANGRSISISSFTFHDDSKTHWDNELEFGAKPAAKTQEKQ